MKMFGHMVEYNDGLDEEMLNYTVVKDEFYSAFIDVQNNLTEVFDDVWCKLRKLMEWRIQSVTFI